MVANQKVFYSIFPQLSLDVYALTLPKKISLLSQYEAFFHYHAQQTLKASQLY